MLKKFIQSEILAGIKRHALTIIGGFLLAKGYADNQQMVAVGNAAAAIQTNWTPILGGMVALVGILQSIAHKIKTEGIVKALEEAAGTTGVPSAAAPAATAKRWILGEGVSEGAVPSAAAPAATAKPPLSALAAIALLAFFMIGTTGCTRFITASGDSHVITTISSTVFGINLTATSATTQTPAIQLGLVRQTVQFLPFAIGTNLTTTNTVNGTNLITSEDKNKIFVPDYATTYDINQGIDPFSFVGYESFASGHVSTFEASQKTNTVTSTPSVATTH